MIIPVLLSKKQKYILAISFGFLLFSTLRIAFAYKNYLTWKSRNINLINYKKEMLTDTSWTQWKAPKEVLKYISLWLFNLDHKVKIQKNQIIDDVNGIQYNVLRIQSDNLAKIKIALQNPPFGKIAITNESIDTIAFTWYWSNKIGENKSIQAFDDFILLSLDTILILEDGWMIKLNNQWFDNKSTFTDNLQILSVDKYSVCVRILVPNGSKTVTMKCGTGMRVDLI